MLYYARLYRKTTPKKAERTWEWIQKVWLGCEWFKFNLIRKSGRLRKPDQALNYDWRREQTWIRKSLKSSWGTWGTWGTQGTPSIIPGHLLAICVLRIHVGIILRQHIIGLLFPFHTYMQNWYKFEALFHAMSKWWNSSLGETNR